MGRWNAAAVVAGLWLLAWTVGSYGQANAPGEAGKKVTVLDARSAWRIFHVLKPPVFELDAGLKPLTTKYAWLDRETPAAPAAWTQAEFDDATWLRDGARGGAKTPYLAELCARARFEVTDLARAGDLKLSVAYYGGVVVYVNGKEIARKDVAKEGPAAGALAESYPAEAFVSEKGELVGSDWQAEKFPKVLAARERKLADVVIPASALQKGVNVLAVEVVRAPYHKVTYDYWKVHAKQDNRELREPQLTYECAWNTCELRDVTLTAGGGGVAVNTGRPKEMQVWNADLLTPDLAGDVGDRCGALRPVVIRGARNAWSSGKVVVGAGQAIEGLKVTCGPLTQGGATIPATAVRARFAVPEFGRADVDMALEALVEQPLASFPLVRNGAVVPVWLTVKVPAEAKAGAYTGQMTIEAKGQKTVTVPVRLEVADYAVPDTQNYRTWIEVMQSPDTLALEYKTPLWSEQHWGMIKDSMRYIGEIGSRVVQIPLIAQTNSGNAESMVRFIKKADGTYDYDFSILDKYLDLAVATMGPPKFVAFIAWEIYLDTPKQEVALTEAERQKKDDDWASMEKSWSAARWDLRGKGPAVTALDPATGQTSTINLPRFEDPAAQAIWKPLFDALHKRMAARGLEKTMLLGMASDRWASPAEMKVLEEVSGNLPWIHHTHGGNQVGSKLDGIAPVAYTAYVWNNEYPNDPAKGRNYGWKRPELYAEFRRFTAYNDYPLAGVKLFPELEITGKQRGLGRIGGDFWPVMKDKRGERRGWAWNRYPQSLWHSCNLMSHLLSPGPNGPVATVRYEVLREGVQECEARIALEAVLTDAALKERMGADLADRCQKLLDDRVEEELKGFTSLQVSGRVYTTYDEYGKLFYYGAGGAAGAAWYAGSGWQERAQELYRLAGEVQRKVGPK